ncbi:MAG: SpoIID/LytB domain-containing protein [Chlamydiota bacterium]
MRFLWCIFFMAGSLLAENTLPSKQAESVKILIQQGAKEALLEAKGPYYIFNPKDHSRITSGLLGKRFLVHATEKGIKWGETFLDIHQISLVPRSESCSLLVNGVQYDGSLSIYAKEDRIHIVNEVLIEDYVNAVLAKEFLYPIDTEVLSAVAILARTSAHYYAKNPQSLWHLDAQEIDYVGSFLRTPGSFIDKVIKSTKGLILVHDVNGKKEAFPATWTEHSGGKTAAFSAIFRKEALCPSISASAPYALNDRKDSNWIFSIDKGALAKKCGMQDIENIELFIDHESKKSYAVRLVGKQEQKDLNFFAFQKLLGKDCIQSNDFTIESTHQELIFDGYGKGHGVGLCLYSAGLMAEKGDNALQILTKFYEGTSLYNLTAKLASNK